MAKEDQDNSPWRFPKLVGSSNVQAWERHVTQAFQAARLEGFLNNTKTRPPVPTMGDLEKMTWSEKQQSRREQEEYDELKTASKGRLVGTVSDAIQQTLDTSKTCHELWTALKERYKAKGWGKKWAALNRLEQISYADSKSISSFGHKLQNSAKEIKELNITMDESLVIRALNSLGPAFETYVAIINEKARSEEKLPDLDDLIVKLEEEETRMKNNTSINLTRTDSGDSTRGGRNPRGGRNGRGGGAKGNSGGGNGDKGNNNNNSDNPWCGSCQSTDHPLGWEHCPDKDETCNNCKRRGHKTCNCTAKGGAKCFNNFNNNKKNSNKGKQKNSSANSGSSTPKGQTPTEHMGHIAIPDDLAYNENQTSFGRDNDAPDSSDRPSVHIGLMHTEINKLEVRLNKLYVFTASSGLWILDSGATNHCTGNKALFEKLQSVNETARTASGELLPIKGIGPVRLNLANNDQLILSNTVYIPSLTMNIISTACFWRRDISIDYPAGQPCNIMKNGVTIANGDYHEGLFVLRTKEALLNNVKIIPPRPVATMPIEEMIHATFIAAFKKTTTSIETWHRRLAHLGYRNVIANAKKVKGMEGVTGPAPQAICEPCMAGRQQAEPTRVPMTKPTEFLQCISIDIGGPLPTTWQGNKIFILAREEYSGLLFFEAKKLKSEIFRTVIDLVAKLERQSGRKVKAIRGGGELQTKAFDEWFKTSGIEYKPSAPYTPEQNAFVE